MLAVSDPLPPSSSIDQSTSQDFAVPGFDFSQILSLKQTCSSVQAMKSLSLLSIVNVTLDSGDLICDNSKGNLSPLVPEVLHKPLFLACSPQRLSSWNQWFTEVGLLSFCLAWFVSRCRRVGQVLSPVSTEQDTESHENFCACHPCSFKTIFSRTHRHRWSSTV